jgi:hypothetical protein
MDFATGATIVVDGGLRNPLSGLDAWMELEGHCGGNKLRGSQEECANPI